MSEIAVYKLVTGEWIVGRREQVLQVVEDITLDKPLVVRMMPNGPTSYALGLVPFDPINPESKVNIRKAAIVAESVNLPKGFVDAYIKQTSDIEIVTDLGSLK